MKKKTLMGLVLVGLTTLSGCGSGAKRLSEKDYRVTHKSARKAMTYDDMPSTGVSKVLVLPIDFEDFPAENLPGGKENYLKYLENSFFGSEETTTWNSLRTFYQKSSYDKLHIEGEVFDWYRSPKTAAELGAEAKGGGEGALAANLLNKWWMDQILDYKRDFKQFDGDGDGLIDAIFMVYSAPFHAKDPETGVAINNSFFWAFRSVAPNSPDPRTPAPSNYMWASQEFMFDAGYYDEEGNHNNWTEEQLASGNAKPDAHTFIHETGHMIGLDDYYSYDRGKGDYGGLGGLDMMDFNIGDHNGYSKWMLGWLHPQMVKKAGVVTLKPLAKEGDAIIIPANWTGNVNSEYILIDYYTPEGLFKEDSVNGYNGGGYPLFYSEPGIRVFHVDARTGVMRYNSVTGTFSLVNYVDNVVSYNGDGNYYGIVHANSISRTGNQGKTEKYWKLIEMLDVGETGDLKKSNAIATNEMLFKVGDTFGYDTYTDFEFHSKKDDGTPYKMPFKFEVLEMNEKFAKIKFA